MLNEYNRLVLETPKWKDFTRFRAATRNPGYVALVWSLDDALHSVASNLHDRFNFSRLSESASDDRMQKSAQLRQKNTLGPRLARLISDCLPILCWKVVDTQKGPGAYYATHHGNWWRRQQRALWSFRWKILLRRNYFWLLDESCSSPHHSRLFDLP